MSLHNMEVGSILLMNIEHSFSAGNGERGAAEICILQNIGEKASSAGTLCNEPT